MKYISILLFVGLLIFVAFETKAQGTFSSANSGDWNNPITWTLTGGTSATNYPVAGDDITIQSGHIVEVNVISQVQSVNVIAGATLSFNTSTVNSVLTIADQLTVSNASSVVVNMGALTILGNVTVSAASSITQNGGAITVSGFIFVNAPTAVTSPTTGTSLINVDLGIFNCVGGLTLTSSTNASRIAELRVGLSAVNIVGALTTTTANSKITFSNVGVLTLAGVVTIPNTSSFSAGNGKVLYVGIPGIDQTVAPLTYNRLSISGFGAGLKKITNTVTVTDTLALLTDTLTIIGGGVLNMNNATTLVRTEGFLKDLPTFLGTANLLYNGVTNTVTGKEMPTNTAVLQTLVINNVSGINLGANVTVNNKITLQNGILNTNGFTLNITNPAGGVGTDPAVTFTNGYVQGKINRSIDTSTGTRIFPFGISLVNGSRILSLDYTSAPAVGGTLEVQHFEGTVPAESGLPLVDGTVTLDSSLPTYWRADATGLSGGNYTLSLTAQGIAGITDYTTLRVLKRPTSGGAWVLDGNADVNTGSNSQPTVIRNSMSGFSEFAIGNRSAMFRTAGAVNFTSATNWEISGDGSVWSSAIVAPSHIHESITIRSGHTATITIDATLDQVIVENGGTLEVSAGRVLNLQDGTGTDLTIQNGGILELQGSSTLVGAGSLTIDAGGMVKIAHTTGLQAITLSGAETFSASANYELDGTTLQTLNSPTGFTANNLIINNIANAQLNDDITITGTLTVALGYLDLNGNDITLNGNLVENRASNRVIKDLTATNETSQGGSIIFSATITDATGEIAGTGLYLRGAIGANYSVNVARKHYKGAGKGITRIYQITGTPNQPTTMRIYYANSETTDVGNPLSFVLFRWTSAEGWQSANGTNFSNGTNDIINRYTEATNVTAFSHWTIGSNNAPLPITLLGFAVERVEGLRGERTEEVKLEWSTGSEINNKGFDVEMSEDGRNYEKIAFIEGRGNSTTIQSYNHTTLQPYDSYYRLKQVDFDGAFSYSPVVFVEGLVGKVVVYPNPNNGKFTISVGKDKLDSPTRLLNAVGKEVWRGMQTEVRTKDLPAGMYFLHTAVAGKTKITKVVIER